MPDPSPSLFGRLARLGPAGLFQRLRNLMLRPVRHELADVERHLVADARALHREAENLHQEAAALRRELAALREQSQIDLHAGLAGPRQALDGLARQQRLLEGMLASGLDALRPTTPHARAPLVSIVLPTRNRASCLGDAIDSVLSQSYTNWELLVVDDGSEDGTAALLARYEDPRLRKFAIAHAGASAARNHALREARGELVAYIDSDNTWFAGYLAGAVAAFEADPALDLGYGVLASEAHAPGELTVIGPEFDRELLRSANYIDLNVVVHRRALYQSLGGFDESLRRMVDWELLLRYTEGRAVRLLPVLAARYRVRDRERITDTVPSGPALMAIRRRLDARPAPARQPRVLYVVWHYPQLSETYVEGEIRCMRRMGAEVEVWHQIHTATPYEPEVPTHDGDLAALVRRFRPDVLHVHWLSFALDESELLASLGVPVTVRMHGFDVHEHNFHRLLEQPWLHRVYAFPRQLSMLPAPDPRVRAVPAAFDTSYFGPVADKDPRLVLRAGACLPSKDYSLFFELARRLPAHHFVFCGIRVNKFEHYPDELVRIAREMESPVELRFNLPRAEMSALMGRAGIYLHTITPPTHKHGAPIGQPISIAEAMATGAWTLVRDEPELVDYVGGAGAAYKDIDEAEALLRRSLAWSPADWRERAVRTSDWAFWNHADEVVLRPIYEDWLALAARAPASTPA